MIVSDLDGTLLTSGHTVSARTSAAVREWRRRGGHFVIATGRPVRDTRATAESLGYRTAAICGNGSVTYDFETEQVVDHHPIRSALVLEVLQAIRESCPGVLFGAEQGLDLVLEPAFVLNTDRFADGRPIARLEDALTSTGCTKLIAQLPGDARTYLPQVALALPPGCEVTVSGAAFCEITLAGVTKAAAAARLAGQLGISAAEVTVFGDMPNDLPLFEWAGRAVAVANADPSVLLEADEVTGSNDDDGVADHIESMMPTS
jgi:Cof subfamily protein (haloacid dehalogenase superfamily)